MIEFSELTREQAFFDQPRSDLHISYLNDMLKVIWEDEVEVAGALVWSFADNREWGTFAHKFGLQAGNLSTQECTYKRSMFDLVDFYQSHGGRT